MRPRGAGAAPSGPDGGGAPPIDIMLYYYYCYYILLLLSYVMLYDCSVYHKQ